MKTNNSHNAASEWVVSQVDSACQTIQSQILRIDPTLDPKVISQIAWGSVAALYFNTALKLIGEEMLDDEWIQQHIRSHLPEKKTKPAEYDVSDLEEHSSWYDEITFNLKTGETYRDRDIREIPMKFSVQLFNTVYEPDGLDEELNHCFKIRYCSDEIRQCLNEFLAELQRRYLSQENEAMISRYTTGLSLKN